MKNLKTLRENIGKTQRDCAQELGLTKTTFCYYEQGKVNPPMPTLISIADYFGCSIDYLLGHETKNILHLDGFNEEQLKMIDYAKRLDHDQLLLAIGWISHMIGENYSQTKPARPW